LSEQPKDSSEKESSVVLARVPGDGLKGTSLIHIHGLKLQTKAILGNKVDKEQSVSSYITAPREKECRLSDRNVRVLIWYYTNK
jgi:hypothetical protein